MAVTDRPGNAPLSESDKLEFPIITSFSELYPNETSAKKNKGELQ